MRWYCLPGIFLFGLILSGCAYLQAINPNAPEKINLLTTAEQYGKALEIIKHIPANNPNYQQIKQQEENILALAKQLEEQTVKKARQLSHDNKWHQAQQLYDQTLSKLPNSTLLKKEYQHFLATREILLDQLELELDLNRARWLIANTPVQQEMIHIIPEINEEFAELNDYQTQKEKTAQHLLQFTVQALADNDHVSARTMIDLIDNLMVIPPNNGQLTLARTKLQDLERKQQRKEEKLRQIAQKQSQKKRRLKKIKQEEKRRLATIKLEKKTKEIITSLQQSLTMPTLAIAKQQLDYIAKNKVRYPLRQDLHTELDKIFRQGIEYHLQKGRKLYSQGKISEALTIWQPLHNIAPDDPKLQTYINRATRVLDKLKHLKVESWSVKNS